MEHFQYDIEKHIVDLHWDIVNGTYRHGTYDVFTVSDNKRREVAVASLRDRLLHRFVYDYLELIYDRVFIYDAWSCRKEKGLHDAIDRAQHYLQKHRHGYFWRGDVQKFFDNVDHGVLLACLQRRITDDTALALLREIIGSYDGSTVRKDASAERESNAAARKGIPIGNVTSQIFANIYLHELDRFVKHDLRVRGYLRYGDDFVLFGYDRMTAERWRTAVITFLADSLKLSLHSRNDVLLPCRRGLRFLGYEIFPSGRRLRKRMKKRMERRLDLRNLSSYRGMILTQENAKHMRLFNWQTLNVMETEFLE